MLQSVVPSNYFFFIPCSLSILLCDARVRYDCFRLLRETNVNSICWSVFSSLFPPTCFPVVACWWVSRTPVAAAVCFSISPLGNQVWERRSRLAGLAAMTDLADRVRALGKASLCLGKQEVAECQRIAEVIKAHMARTAKEILATSGLAPVLLVYQSDTTPLRTRVIFTSKDAAGSMVRRCGFHRHEYLLQCGFVATTGAEMAPQQAALLAEPISVPNKLAWTLFAACKHYFPLLKSLKNEGICVTAYVYDRAQFSSLGRLCQQRHELFVQQRVPAASQAEARLCDWVVVLPCAAHDTHNGLKWGLGTLYDLETHSKNLYVCVDSLRNSFHMIHSMLAKFITDAVRFYPMEQCVGPATLQQLWLALGLESSLVDELVKLRLLYRDGYLQVLDAHSRTPDLHESIHHCLLSVLRIRRFTSSRWCSMGASCRQLLASVLLGVGAIVQKCLDDPACMDFYLNGYKMLVPETVEFVIVCALSSYVADAALTHLLADSRVPHTLEDLETSISEELEFLQEMDSDLYEPLSSACPLAQPAHLRSQVLLVACASHAFISERVLEPAKKYPWCLLHGDMSENLEKLRVQDCPDESVSRKIWQLLALGSHVVGSDLSSLPMSPTSTSKTGVSSLADLCFWDPCSFFSPLQSSIPTKKCAAWAPLWANPPATIPRLQHGPPSASPASDGGYTLDNSCRRARSRLYSDSGQGPLWTHT